MRDKNLKRAIASAINRQEIIDKVFMGEGYPLYMYAKRVEVGYDPETGIEFAYNPGKARVSLKESLYKTGTQLILSYPASSPQGDTVATLIQQYLKKIGLAVKLITFETGIFVSYALRNDKALGHMMLYAWPGGVDPSVRLQFSTHSNNPYCSYRARLDKDEIDALLEAQAHELDKEKQLELLAQIHRKLSDDSSDTALYGLNQIYAMSERIDWIWGGKDQSPFNLVTIKLVK